jgi:hypothetical protein
MLNVRTHQFMGRAVVSVHCTSHGLGNDHCLWSGRSNIGVIDAWEVIAETKSALEEVLQMINRGALETLTSECVL